MGVVTRGYASLDRYSGVRALWIKVIIRAVFDWVSYRDSDRLQLRKLAESAETWLFLPTELFNGFPNVCLYLGIDPDDVRGWARNMSREQVAKIEHLERYPSAKNVEAKIAAAYSGK